MSAKEIQFSRDDTTKESLEIKYEDIANLITEYREKNNNPTQNVAPKHGKLATPAGAEEGNLIFLNQEGDKSSRSDLYLVTNKMDDDKVTVCKLRNAISNKPANLAPQAYTIVLFQIVSRFHILIINDSTEKKREILIEPSYSFWQFF